MVRGNQVFSFSFFFFILVTGPRRSLSLKLSDTEVYEPQIRARVGTRCSASTRIFADGSGLCRGTRVSRIHSKYTHTYFMYMRIFNGIFSTHIYTYIYIYTYKYIYIYIYIYISKICIYVYMYIDKHVYIYTAQSVGWSGQQTPSRPSRSPLRPSAPR